MKILFLRFLLHTGLTHSVWCCCMLSAFAEQIFQFSLFYMWYYFGCSVIRRHKNDNAYAKTNENILVAALTQKKKNKYCLQYVYYNINIGKCRLSVCISIIYIMYRIYIKIDETLDGNDIYRMRKANENVYIFEWKFISMEYYHGKRWRI